MEKIKGFSRSASIPRALRVGAAREQCLDFLDLRR